LAPSSETDLNQSSDDEQEDNVTVADLLPEVSKFAVTGYLIVLFTTSFFLSFIQMIRGSWN
jgi:hypothetical protein